MQLILVTLGGNVFTSGGVGSRTRGVYNAGDSSITCTRFYYHCINRKCNKFWYNLERQGKGLSDQLVDYFRWIGPSPTRRDSIEYVTIASTGNAQDFGDDSNVLNHYHHVNSTRGISCWWIWSKSIFYSNMLLIF